MKQITHRIILVVLLSLFLMAFFFKIIPVPIESVQGNLDKNHFVFGGFYWTSLNYELYVNNFLGVGVFSSMFAILIIGTKLLYENNKKGVKNGYNIPKN